MEIDAALPEKLEMLFRPMRYKVAYGGRGGGKSHSFAIALLTLAAQKPIRILCTREIQKSIKQSVHALLSDQIKALSLGANYQILETEIRGTNGTEFAFSGLAHHTVESIKSIEGVDICWVEEAQTVSKKSWDILIPTIRKAGSEIWVTFNPATRYDDTYRRFCISPPTESIVREINWIDNLWFPPELEKERLDMLKNDPIAYENVWNGKVKSVADGAIWASELQLIESGGRRTGIPYDPVMPVHTVWDLGVSDSTTIWFYQSVGREIRIIDYYEATGEGLPHYANVLTARGYVYGKHYAPHDIQVRELGSGRSRIETARQLGINFQTVPNIPIEDGIHAVRMLLPRCWFDRLKTERGWECITNYKREFNDKMGEFKPLPKHDWASHASDAFRYLAVSMRDERTTEGRKPATNRSRGSGGWMG